MITKLFFFVASLALSTGHPYNDYKYFWNLTNPYPDTCCQLEWTDIRQGDPLPDDYVHAGKFMDRDWAFVGIKYGNIAAKSDQDKEEPNWMGWSGYKVHPYPILTNPNKCSLGWYRTRFNGEQIPRNQEWFFPPLSEGRHTSFGQYQGVPAKVWDNGAVWTLSSLTEAKGPHPKNYDLLYVDCKKSILSMSKANITFKNTSGMIVSPQIQSWIIHAIGKGLRGQALCKNITHYMNNNHGNYWNCFVKAEHFEIYSENSVYFNLDGVDWVVFKGKQDETDKDKISAIEKEKESLQNKLSSIEKELTITKSDLEQKQKEHDDYVKKMNGIKAILDKLLLIDSQ